ncbi:MAG TPA: alpha/beta hydrolase [Candidatus Brachybacterium merdigallinarum]|nr:alpha/beta hydrolase [Candidatus Brachybacterium merdigallinarum]
MNPLKRAALALYSLLRIDVPKDYERVRRVQRQMAARPGQQFRTLDLWTAARDGLPPVAVRVFRPRVQHRDEVLLFFHGGGWVTGDIESYTPACANLAEATGCVVASVDYRLAPEHPFPAGLEDCYRVARMFLEEPELLGIDDPRRIVLVGDSAGGNLAAVVSLVLREHGRPGAGRQILLYPVTYWDHDPETSPFDSVREHGEDYRLTSTEVQDYFALYTPDPAQRQHRLVAPLLAADLTRQPSTLVITAELDLLADEGEAYAAALAEAGNQVRFEEVPDAVHGFISLPRFARPLREAYQLINEFLDAAVESERAEAPRKRPTAGTARVEAGEGADGRGRA